MELSIEWKNKLLNEKIAVRFTRDEDVNELLKAINYKKRPNWHEQGILMRFDKGDWSYQMKNNEIGNSFYKKEGYAIINFEEIVNKTEEFNIWN